MELFEWDAPGPYRVAFSTRRGGVSDGAFRSLNLGLLTGDAAAAVVENRRRLAAAVGADPRRAAMAHQQHGSVVARARPVDVRTPGVELDRCDGLWTDEPGLALSLVTADCLPVALCRIDGSPALAVLHVGWRGVLAGIVAAGAKALGDGLVAVIGPGIGHCCYAVGPEVAEPFCSAYGADVSRGGRLDLRLATERALVAAGCAIVDHVDLCTSCEVDLFFSHRRDRGRTGRQGVIGYVER